jgi:two-component system, NtrC family, nitrogen regulation response regulator NtrX
VRIQIIDDERAIALTLKEFLESLGYECEAFTDPRRALERHCETNFEVVLTDLRMPGMDGIQLMGRLAARSSAPVMIAMTGHAGMENAMACLDCGAYAYFTKPLDLRRLVSILRDLEKSIAGRSAV